MKGRSKYLDVRKEFRQQKRRTYLENNRLYSTFKNRKNKQPDGPDVSTITEHIAFVIDNEVVEIIHCQPKMAAILLSAPQIIKIDPDKFPRIGTKYINGEFVLEENRQDEKN